MKPNSKVYCEGLTLVFTGPGSNWPISTGPDEFEGVNGNFNRRLPAVAASQPVPPPLYTAVARIREYEPNGFPNGPVLCEAEKTIYVPQVVRLEYEADAIDLLRLPLLHPDDNSIVIHPAMEDSHWASFTNNYLGRIRQAFTVDGGVNIRIVGPDADIIGNSYSKLPWHAIFT